MVVFISFQSFGSRSRYLKCNAKNSIRAYLIVAIGPNFTSIMAMGAMISIIITTIVIYTAFREVDPNYLKVLQTFVLPAYNHLKKGHHPLVFPPLFYLESQCRTFMGEGTVGKFLISSKGLGYMIIYGFQVFNFTLVFLALLVIAVFLNHYVPACRSS